MDWSTIVFAFVDIPPGWATVIGSSLAVIGAGMAALVGLVWRQLIQVSRIKKDTAATREDAVKIRSDAEVTRDHVENDHARDPAKTTNLRDDLDKKFEGLAAKFDEQSVHLVQIDEKLAALSATDAAHEERLRDGSAKFAALERTIPKDLLPIEEPSE